MTAGQLIKQARIAKDMTQKQLADALGVSSSMIGQYENDLRKPKFKSILNIAKALDVHPGHLIPDEEKVEFDEYSLFASLYDHHDMAFYSDYKELTEDDKAVLREMARVMRERRQKNTPQD